MGTVPIGLVIRVWAPSGLPARALVLLSARGGPAAAGSVARAPSEPTCLRRDRAVVPDRQRSVWAGIDRDQVHPQRHGRQARSVGQRPRLEQRGHRATQGAPLAVVERLLRETEVTTPASPHLDDDEPRRRAGIDRDEVELVTTEADVAAKDDPAGGREPRRD